jgi:hypothetical protein
MGALSIADHHHFGTSSCLKDDLFRTSICVSAGASAEKLASHFRCGHSDMAGVLCALEEEFEVYRSGAAYHIM